MFAVAAGQVNGGLVKFFHGVQVAIMLMLMTNIIQFAYHSCQRMRRGDGHWYMYKPVYLVTLSTPMVLLQPTCMLIIGSWICDGNFSADQLTGAVRTAENTPDGCIGYICTSENTPAGCIGNFKADGTFSNGSFIDIAQFTNYVDGCSDGMQNFFFDGGANSNALLPNTTIGWCIQVFGTYLGFFIMFVGVCQATQLHMKIVRKWQDIRGAN